MKIYLLQSNVESWTTLDSLRAFGSLEAAKKAAAEGWEENKLFTDLGQIEWAESSDSSWSAPPYTIQVLDLEPAGFGDETIEEVLG